MFWLAGERDCPAFRSGFRLPCLYRMGLKGLTCALEWNDYVRLKGCLKVLNWGELRGWDNKCIILKMFWM